MTGNQIGQPVQYANALEQVVFTLPEGAQVSTYVGGPEQGAPVVLLHGGGTDNALLSWQDTMPALMQAGYRVYAPSFPGYGESPPHELSTTTDGLIRSLEALMDIWQLETAALVGLSMGGGLAIGYTLANQECVDRLVLVGPYGIQDRVPFHFLSYLYVRLPWVLDAAWAMMRRSRSTTRYMLNSLIRNPESRTETLVDQVMEAIQNPHSQRTFAQWQRDEMGPSRVKTNYTGQLHEIAVPVLLVHGSHDAGVPLAYAERAVSRFPNARLEVFENAGHWTQRDYPERFNRLLLEFLADR